MAIFLDSSKTDKHREGSRIVIARTGTCFCPVSNVEKLVKWAGLKGDDFLLCNLCKTMKGYSVRNTNQAMSYSNLRFISGSFFSSC